MRVPPHNIDVEKSLLGSILIDPDAIIKVGDIIIPECFYDPAHREIFSVILELFEQRKPLDIVTISDNLKKRSVLKKVGGRAYLTELANYVPTASNVEEYASLVKGAYTRRELVRVGGEISTEAFDQDNTIERTLDNCQQALFKIAQGSTKKGFVTARSLLKETYERAAEVDKNKGSLLGISSSFSDIDKPILCKISCSSANHSLFFIKIKIHTYLSLPLVGFGLLSCV